MQETLAHSPNSSPIHLPNYQLPTDLIGISSQTTNMTVYKHICNPERAKSNQSASNRIALYRMETLQMDGLKSSNGRIYRFHDKTEWFLRQNSAFRDKTFANHRLRDKTLRFVPLEVFTRQMIIQ